MEEEVQDFEWSLHYSQETPPEIEASILEMERELIRSLEVEKGNTITIEPFSVVRTLLSRLMVEQKIFAQVINIALDT